MSVTSIRAYDAPLTTDDDGHRTYDAVYHVYTNDKDDGSQVVYAAMRAAFPPYTPYVMGIDSDPVAFSRRPKSIKRGVWKETRRKWTVVMPYTTKPSSTCQEEDFDNPLTAPPKMSGSFFRHTKIADKDRNGVPLGNSADEPEITEVDDSRDTVIIEFVTNQLYLALRSQLRNKCNADELWGLPARTIKLAQWKWVIEYYGTCTPYVRNILEVEIDLDKWNFRRIDQGYRIKNGVDAAGNQKYSKLMDDRDQPLQKPRLLDGAGGLLAAAAEPEILEDEVVDEADFTLLTAIGLPNPLV